MRILWVATKPPWPPGDGGRLLVWNSLGGLAEAGHEITLVAPTLLAPGSGPARLEQLESHLAERCRPSLVQAGLGAPWVDAVRSGLARQPWTLVRHALPAVRRRVHSLVAEGGWDAVHVEQVQAIAAVRGLDPSVPVVLRAQNVESDLWRAQAEGRPWPAAAWFRHQARGLARAEGRAVGHADHTLALTPRDAARLAELAREAGVPGPRSGKATVQVVAAPFATELEAGSMPLDGAPPLVVFGSAGWRPNRAGADWFVRRVWPRVHQAHPNARLHLFGGGSGSGGGPSTPTSDPALVRHPAPASSRDALAAGSLLVVPLHAASGVRMKILEAWARGIPVLATTVAARGLDVEHGRQLWIADSAEGFVAGVAHLADPEARRAMVQAGRQYLAEHHAPRIVAAKLAEVYRQASR